MYVNLNPEVIRRAERTGSKIALYARSDIGGHSTQFAAVVLHFSRGRRWVYCMSEARGQCEQRHRLAIKARGAGCFFKVRYHAKQRQRIRLGIWAWEYGGAGLTSGLSTCRVIRRQQHTNPVHGQILKETLTHYD